MRWGALRGFRGLAARSDLAGGRRAVCREGRPGRRGCARESRGLCRGCGEGSHDHRTGGPQSSRCCSYLCTAATVPSGGSAHLCTRTRTCAGSVQVTSVVATAQLGGGRWDSGWVNSKRLFGVAEREPPWWPSRPAAGALACLRCCCTGALPVRLCGHRPGRWSDGRLAAGVPVVREAGQGCRSYGARD
jgi:hypothetical protein